VRTQSAETNRGIFIRISECPPVTTPPPSRCPAAAIGISAVVVVVVLVVVVVVVVDDATSTHCFELRMEVLEHATIHDRR
jgi:hypothetical protein